MDKLIIVSMGLLPLSMISFVFGSSTYSSMPGSKADVSVLGEDELLVPNHDLKQYARLQEKHQEVAKLVASARQYSWTRADLQATSQTMLRVVECYEEIREEANSAVVELNLAILAKARIKIERELGDDPELIKALEEYCNNTLQWAGWLLNEEPERYDPVVKICYDKLKAAQDVRA